MRTAWTSRTRTTRTAAGVRTGWLTILCLGASACVLACWPLPSAAASGDKQSKKAQNSYALIAGTVFRHSGLSLPGAEITVTPNLEQEQGEKAGKQKKKRLKAVSDARGEFAVRVPARPMQYTVSIKAAGFQEQEKQVQIHGDERVDLFFRLEQAPK